MCIDTPPTYSQWVYRVADLPPERGSADYTITDGDGNSRVVTLAKRKRQIIELLMQGPVHCASPVRISDIVHILKREIGLDVETKMYPGNQATGAGSYGIYFLRSDVRRVAELQVAARLPLSITAKRQTAMSGNYSGMAAIVWLFAGTAFNGCFNAKPTLGARLDRDGSLSGTSPPKRR